MIEPKLLSDGQLLAEFAATGSQTAFAEIVSRHGAMVQAVARRVVGDYHEAEDVTQAAFLTLARKASSLRKDSSVGAWLHHVAWCLAQDAWKTKHRRAGREAAAMRERELTEPVAVDPQAFAAELDAAINQLAERYRRPLVLFHLEGQTLQQTAVQLGLNPATAGTRLARARELLRKKLVRRGIGVGSVGALTALLSTESGAAVLPATIVASTVSAATGGAVSTTVAALAKGALNMLFWSHVKLAGVVAVATVVVTSTGVVVAQKVANNPGPANPAVDARVLLVEAQKRMKDQRLFEAIPLFDQAWANAQDDGVRAEILYWLGETHKRAGNDVDAIRCWRQLVQQHPTSQWAKMGHGQLEVAAKAATGKELSGPAPVATSSSRPDPGADGAHKVFKPIDTTQSGTYADGKWSYALEIKGDQRQGFLKYDAKNVGDPQPGDHILTPWGWMQWQEQGNWLPVAEKPAKGKQLPDPAK